MKTITSMLLLTILSLLSCSKDNSANCESKRQEIIGYYNNQIEQIKNNTTQVYGIDYRTIAILMTERDKKLENACK